MNIKPLIIETIEKIITLSVLFLCITWFMFKLDGITYSFKEALTVTMYLLGALSTIAAAYIAANLFNNWKDIHDKDIWNKFVFEVLDQFNKLEDLSRSLSFESCELRATLLTIPNTNPSDQLTPNELNDIKTLIDKCQKLTHLFEQVTDRIRFFGIVTQCSDQMELLNTEFRTQLAAIDFEYPTTYADAEISIRDYLQSWTNLSSQIEINLIQKLLRSIQIKPNL